MFVCIVYILQIQHIFLLKSINSGFFFYRHPSDNHEG